MDFPESITVTVTEEHIRLGKACDSLECPIALAATPLFPGYEISVGVLDLGVMTPLGPDDVVGMQKDVATYGLTERAGHWVKRFDVGRGVEPTTFTLSRIATREPVTISILPSTKEEKE